MKVVVRKILSLLTISAICSHADTTLQDSTSVDLSLGRAHLFGEARVINGKTIEALALPDHSRAEIELSSQLTTARGTLVAWIKPLWKEADVTSHTFLTLGWDGLDGGYLALSNGWWEPAGNNRLYFILSNQEYAFCHTPGEFNYRFFSEGEWTMLAATWSAGSPGYLTLYIDGEKICEKHIAFSETRSVRGPLHIGSDLGASDRRSRPSDFIIDNIKTSQQPMSEAQIWRMYRQQGGEYSRKWMQTLINKSGAKSEEKEIRMIFDEDAHWVTSKSEIQRTISRVKAAGFNVYVPCIWHGGEALFKTKDAPMARSFQEALRAGYDPLSYLITVAHEQGIEVHPWFEVMRRETDVLPISLDGAPAGAFNVHDPEFRKFITELIANAIDDYAVDGINLDYIRSIGQCVNVRCKSEYRGRYGRTLLEDLRAFEKGQRVPELISWNREAVTEVVRQISMSVREKRPHALLTVDTIPFDESRLHQGVDETGWLSAGYIDAVVYMAYETPLDIARAVKAARQYGKDRLIFLFRNYEMLDGQASPHSGVVSEDYVRLVRTQWPHSGVGFYHYPHLTNDQITTLQKTAFSTPAFSVRRK